MTIVEIEKERLGQLAEEFRGKGYEVVLHPRSADLPGFLAPFQVDLIAKSAKENVVVQVKSSPELRSEALVRLAKAVEKRSGWRFELLVINPSAALEVPMHSKLVGEAKVNGLLREAEALNDDGRHEAAAMLAWSAAESVLRRLAKAAGFESERKSSAAVLKELYAAGKLTAEEYEDFSRAMEFRNAFSHGFAARIDGREVKRMLRDLAELRSRPAA